MLVAIHACISYRDIILVVLSLPILHFTPIQRKSGGKHGSFIQFFLIPYSILIAMMASTSIGKEKEVSKKKCLNNIFPREQHI